MLGSIQYFWSFGIIGVLFIVVSILISLNSKRKTNICTTRVNGKVKDILEESNADDSTNYYHPVFEYKIDGSTFEKRSIYGYSKKEYKIGGNVEIFYNPNNPNEFYVKGYNAPKKVEKIFLILGVIFVLIQVVMLIIL